MEGVKNNFEIYDWTDMFGLWKMLSLSNCCWPNCVLKSMIIFLSQINRRKSRSRLTKEKVPLHVITFYSGFLQTILDVLQSSLPSLSERFFGWLQHRMKFVAVKLLALLTSLKRYRYLWQNATIAILKYRRKQTEHFKKRLSSAELE